MFCGFKGGGRVDRCFVALRGRVDRYLVVLRGGLTGVLVVLRGLTGVCWF